MGHPVYFSFNDNPSPLLVVTYGIGILLWTIAYYKTISNAIKYKYVGIPFFAVCLNFGWEIICSYWFGFPEGTSENLQKGAYLNRIWCLFDLVIFCFLILYGQSQFRHKQLTKNFWLVCLAGLLGSYLSQYLFIKYFDLQILGPLSAYIINLVMSIAYIELALRNYHNKHQNLIGWCKFLGTLIFTLIYMWLNVHEPSFWFVLVMGGMIAAFDVWYIWLINQTLRSYDQSGKK